MTAYPGIVPGGGTLEIGVETALGSGSAAYVDQRSSDTSPTLPTGTRQGKDVPHVNREHFATRDGQITYEQGQEGALTLPMFVSRATATGTGLPQCMTMLESMGCDVVTTTGTTLAGYTDTGAFSLVANAATDVGNAGLLGLTDGTLYPCLPSAFSGGDVTPSMDIPSGSDAGEEWGIMHTAIPRVRQVPTTKTVAARSTSYYQHTANESAFTFTGVAGSEVADVVFEPLMPVEMAFTAHAADIAGPTDRTIAAEVFQDSSKFAIVDGDSPLHFNFADFADPITSNSRECLLKATWTPGISVTPIPGIGCSASLNGWQGFLAAYTGSKITLEMLMDKTKWSDYEGSNTEKYIAIVQPSTSVAATAFGLWMPKCRIYGAPTTELYSEDTLKVTVTYEPTVSEYGSDTGADSRGMAPWYFAISGEATP